MSKYLNQMAQDELLRSEPWPKDAILGQPYETEQMLLPEFASCLAVRAYLQMRGLPFTIENYANAEYMSPGGRMTKLPFLRAGDFIMSEFEPIVSFVQQKQGILADWLNEDERADMHTYVSLVENIFTMAEYWISFVNEKNYKLVTARRIACAYPWPLSTLQVYRKRRQAMRLLRVYQWHDMLVEDVMQKVDKCCETLLPKLLNDNLYFYGDQPCELDAVVFGHLFAILATSMPNMALAQVVIRHQHLVEYCQRFEKNVFNSKALLTMLEAGKAKQLEN